MPMKTGRLMQVSTPGSYPEGVSFAILLMNSFVPLINRYFRPAIFGEKERRQTA